MLHSIRLPFPCHTGIYQIDTVPVGSAPEPAHRDHNPISGRNCKGMTLSNRRNCNIRCILDTYMDVKDVEVSPMDKESRIPTDINKLVNHLKELTTELTAVHSELYWLALQEQDVSAKETPAELNIELLAELKGAVDTMRIMLWKYIETASEIDPQKVQDGLESQRLRRVTEFLQLLRDRLVQVPDQQPMSFIERINAAVKERLSDRAA